MRMRGREQSRPAESHHLSAAAVAEDGASHWRIPQRIASVFMPPPGLTRPPLRLQSFANRPIFETKSRVSQPPLALACSSAVDQAPPVTHAPSCAHNISSSTSPISCALADVPVLAVWQPSHLSVPYVCTHRGYSPSTVASCGASGTGRAGSLVVCRLRGHSLPRHESSHMHYDPRYHAHFLGWLVA